MSPRKKKGYYTVITIVGIALMVDRLVLQSGSPESAAAVQIIVDAPAAELAEVDVDTTMAIPELRFPSNMRPYHPWLMRRDLFAPPKSALQHVASTGNSNGTQKISLSDGALGKEGFKRDVTLNGVIVQQGLKIAVADDQWFRIGQSYYGCTLERVSGNSAVFMCADGEAILQVNSQSLTDQD